jgi:thiol:disulfide interchange protein DsbD
LFARHFFSLAGLLLAAIPAYGQDLLDPEIAFRATARLVRPDLIEVRYQTAPGYYLYRDRLAYVLEPAEAVLGKPKLPAGKTKHDEFFGKQVIYRNLSIVTLSVAAAVDTPLTLTADLQGCADLGVCYPPVRRKFTLSLSAAPGK